MATSQANNRTDRVPANQEEGPDGSSLDTPEANAARNVVRTAPLR